MERLDKLSTALGPNGANTNGAFSDLLDTAAANLKGNGKDLNSTVGRLAQLAGTLDDSGNIRPDAVIYAADRMPWVTLPEGIPHFAETYDPAELLPPERFSRLQALVQRHAAGEG